MSYLRQYIKYISNVLKVLIPSDNVSPFESYFSKFLIKKFSLDKRFLLSLLIFSIYLTCNQHHSL